MLKITNSSRICVVDLDEVVSESNHQLRQVFNSVLGKNYTEDDWNDYNIYKLYGITPEQYYDIWDQYDIIGKASPCEQAIESIDILVSNEICPVFVTARRPDGLDVPRTHAWMGNYNLDCYPVHIIGHTGKGEFIREHYKTQRILAAFDDAHHNLDNIGTLTNVDLLGLIDRPHNRHESDFPVTRFNSLYDGVIHLVTSHV